MVRFAWIRCDWAWNRSALTSTALGPRTASAKIFGFRGLPWVSAGFRSRPPLANSRAGVEPRLLIGGAPGYGSWGRAVPAPAMLEWASPPFSNLSKNSRKTRLFGVSTATILLLYPLSIESFHFFRIFSDPVSDFGFPSAFISPLLDPQHPQQGCKHWFLRDKKPRRLLFLSWRRLMRMRPVELPTRRLVAL